MFNQVTLVGRLTRDPELRYTPEGTAVSYFTLAMNRPFKNNKGDYDADFIQCVLWRKLAENTANFCQKGTLVGVSGRIQSRSYQNNDGHRVYATEIAVERIRFLDKKAPVQQEEEKINLDQLIPVQQ